jgi:hypothetical protein
MIPRHPYGEPDGEERTAALSCCNVHSSTLTLIQDKGNISGEECFRELHAGGVGVMSVDREIRIRKQSSEDGDEPQEFPFDVKDFA